MLVRKTNQDKKMLENNIADKGLQPKEVTFAQSLSSVKNWAFLQACAKDLGSSLFLELLTLYYFLYLYLCFIVLLLKCPSTFLLLFEIQSVLCMCLWSFLQKVQSTVNFYLSWLVTPHIMICTLVHLESKREEKLYVQNF